MDYEKKNAIKSEGTKLQEKKIIIRKKNIKHRNRTIKSRGTKLD
jgi:hypothetical protein